MITPNSEDFCTATETINTLKARPTEGEKIFQTLSDKIISRVCKEFEQLNNKTRLTRKKKII
jgi:hypothetical protein